MKNRNQIFKNTQNKPFNSLVWYDTQNMIKNKYES